MFRRRGGGRKRRQQQQHLQVVRTSQLWIITSSHIMNVFSAPLDNLLYA